MSDSPPLPRRTLTDDELTELAEPAGARPGRAPRRGGTEQLPAMAPARPYRGSGGDDADEATSAWTGNTATSHEANGPGGRSARDEATASAPAPAPQGAPSPRTTTEPITPRAAAGLVPPRRHDSGASRFAPRADPWAGAIRPPPPVPEPELPPEPAPGGRTAVPERLPLSAPGGGRPARTVSPVPEASGPERTPRGGTPRRRSPPTPARSVARVPRPAAAPFAPLHAPPPPARPWPAEPVPARVNARRDEDESTAAEPAPFDPPPLWKVLPERPIWWVSGLVLLVLLVGGIFGLSAFQKHREEQAQEEKARLEAMPPWMRRPKPPPPPPTR